MTAQNGVFTVHRHMEFDFTSLLSKPSRTTARTHKAKEIKLKVINILQDPRCTEDLKELATIFKDISDQVYAISFTTI